MDTKTRFNFTMKALIKILFCLILVAGQRGLLAHTCPPGATATGIGLTVSALRTNGIGIGSQSVGPCEPFIVQMSIVYLLIDPITLGTNAAFEQGRMLLTLRNDTSTVTPVGGIPVLGPAECGGISSIKSLQITSVVTVADAIIGEIPILAVYTNGNAHIGSTDLLDVVGASQGFRIRVRPNVTCEATSTVARVCAGGSASFSVTATNGTAPYTFAWTGPGGFSATGPNVTLNNAQPANSGIFRVVVTDFFGCTNVCEVNLTVNPQPTCSIAPPVRSVCVGSTATFTVTPAGGTGPYAVVWSGPAGFTSTSTNISITNAQPANAGIYRVIVTDSNSCTNVCQAQLIVNPNPTCVVTPPTNRVCAGSPAIFTVVPSGGTAPYTFSWTGPAGFTSTNATITIAIAQLPNAGVYTVVVTDVNGCTTSCQGTLVVNLNPACTIAPPSTGVCAGATATFTVIPSGGTAPYTIAWTGPGGFTSTNLTISIANAQAVNAGIYRAVVTDVNGCTNFCTAQLTVFPNPTCVVAPLTNRVCAGASATFTVTPSGGTAPYRFNWAGPAGFASTNASITINNAQNVNAGAYIVTVTDANNCTTTCQGTLIVNPNPTCAILPLSTGVCAGATATFTVIPSGGTGPYTIAWTGPAGFTSTNLTISIANAQTANAGTYRAVVT